MNREKVTVMGHASSIENMIKYLQDENEGGRVRSLMVILTDDRGYVVCHHTDIPSLSRALGSLELLKDTLLKG